MTLEPSNIILANIYLIMILQLSLNWEKTKCNTDSHLFQLGFIVFMTLRLFFLELFSN